MKLSENIENIHSMLFITFWNIKIFMFKLAEVALQAPSNSPAKWIGPTRHCPSGRASKQGWEEMGALHNQFCAFHTSHLTTR